MAEFRLTGDTVRARAAYAGFLAWGRTPMASAMHFYNRGMPEAAAIYRRLGQPDSSIALLERALGTSSLFAGGSVYEAAWYTQALIMLGELYDARGDRVKAAAYYGKYVEVLDGADPPLAAQVAAVRTKLAGLSGDTRR
jgi:hypothetical protein